MGTLIYDASAQAALEEWERVHARPLLRPRLAETCDDRGRQGGHAPAAAARETLTAAHRASEHLGHNT